MLISIHIMLLDDDYMPIIIRCLNPSRYYKAHQNKARYPITYSMLNLPETYVNSIGGVLYDNDQNVICFDEAVRILKSKKSFIIKPTKGTCSGQDVSKIDVSSCENLSEVLQMYGDDYICQEVVKQSSDTARFCETSLNTFRVSTVNLNGRCTVESVMFKHGRDGSVCDNARAGGITVGVDKNGNFMPYGIDKNLIKYEKAPTGIAYNGVRISNFTNFLKEIEEAHRKILPDMGFVGWDFALDINNCPVFIEVNLGYPGVMFSQLATQSPIFGDRTEEVHKYVASKMVNLNWKNDFLGSAL